MLNIFNITEWHSLNDFCNKFYGSVSYRFHRLISNDIIRFNDIFDSLLGYLYVEHLGSYMNI